MFISYIYSIYVYLFICVYLFLNTFHNFVYKQKTKQKITNNLNFILIYFNEKNVKIVIKLYYTNILYFPFLLYLDSLKKSFKLETSH